MLLAFFSLSAFAGALQPLYSAKADSSSFLKSSWNKYTENYHPNYVLDNNPKTAWVEGVEGNGENEIIVIPVSSVDNVRQLQLRIRNGYQKSKALLRANGAPKDVTVELRTRGGAKITQVTATLKKKMGWQTIDVPVDDAKMAVGLVQLKINTVHSGSKYKDTCISDMEVLVDSDSPYKPKVEAHKQKQLKQWVQKRLDDAKFFANKPKEYPFASVQFDRTDLKVTKSEFAKKYEESRTLPEGVTWDSAYYTRENKSPLQVLPDLVYYMPKDIWRLSDLALFETKKEFAKKEIQEEVDTDSQYIPPRKYLLGNFKRAVNKAGAIQALSFETLSEDCERQCYSVRKKYLIQYSGDVVSKLLVVKEVVDEGPEGTSTDVFMHWFRHTDGKIDGSTYYHKREAQEWDDGSSGEGEPGTFVDFFAFEYTSADKE